MALLAAYLGRRDLARDALVGWLEARGIEADVQFERVEFGGVAGRLRVGPEQDPDFSAERFEADLTLKGFWSGDPLGADVTSVRLVRPVLKVEQKGSKLSFGALDPLIAEFRSRPPRPDARQPRITVEDARLRLETAYGRVTVTGGALLNDGRLMRLDARVPRAALRGQGIAAEVRMATLRLRTAGDRVTVKAEMHADELISDALNIEQGHATLDGEAPYPDFKQRRGDGAVRFALGMRAERLGRGAEAGRQAEVLVNFVGRVSGWLEDATLTGSADSFLRAADLTLGAADMREAGGDVRLTRVTLTRRQDSVVLAADGGGSLHAAHFRHGDVYIAGAVARLKSATLARPDSGALVARGSVALSAERLTQGDLALRTVRSDLRGSLRSAGGTLQAAVDGKLAARGAYTGLGAVETKDPAGLATIKRALADFSFIAPRFVYGQDGDGASLRLSEPATATTAGGGRIVVSALDGAPVYASDGGALLLTAAGGGLPDARLQVDRYTVGEGGVSASTRLNASLDYDLARGAVLQTAGQATWSGGRLRYAARGCAQVQAERLELGENDVVNVQGRLCPVSRPMLELVGGDWRLNGRIDGVSAAAPFLEMRFANAAGPLSASSRNGGLEADLAVTQTTVVDAADAVRFRPLRASGLVALREDVWSGAFGVTNGAGRKLADLRLQHDGAAERGRMDIETGELVFAEGALQPAEVSPLAEMLGAPATGQVRFTGAFAWAGTAPATSEGVAVVRDLGFKSPAGDVTDVDGDIRLTSLAPLVSAPGQTLTVGAVESLAVLRDGQVTFQVDDELLRVEAARFAVGGGAVTAEPFDIPLVEGRTWRGAVQLEGVQLSEVVERSPFADRADLSARVSGRLPFTVSPDGVRVVDGQLAAVEPGRISIKREALTDVDAGGGVAGAPTNAVQDFAYQAMENLAFDTLEAQVNSLDGGRLGAVFKIKGRHDPPTRQEIRLGWRELISRTFMDRPLPLPSGTEVDLTLDTSLNLDELLRDVAAYREGGEVGDGGSAAVQPQGSTNDR